MLFFFRKNRYWRRKFRSTTCAGIIFVKSTVYLYLAYST